MSEVRICIIEDDALTRVSIVKRLEAHPQLTVVGEASTISEAKEMLNTITPHILLVDLQLPDGDGTEIIRQQTQSRPAMPILVISVFGDETRVIAALSAGAQGYLLKDDSGEELSEAILRMLDGQSPISPAIATHLLKRFHQPPKPEQTVDLSERESEVLGLASRGLSYRETADVMGVSVNTIGTYTRRIYTKLAVTSRSEAIFEARFLGLIED